MTVILKFGITLLSITKADSTISNSSILKVVNTSISYCDIIKDKSQRKILAISLFATSSTNKSSILIRFSLNAFVYKRKQCKSSVSKIRRH
jgi:hypothetical protein